MVRIQRVISNDPQILADIEGRIQQSLSLGEILCVNQVSERERQVEVHEQKAQEVQRIINVAITGTAV